MGFGPTPTLTLALTLTLTLTLTNPNPNQERAPCCSACGNSSKKLVSTCHNGARRAVGEGGGATRHAPAQPGTRRHAPSRAVTRRHGLSGSRCAAARVRQRVCAAAHPLELGDGDAFDGRRRQVRVVHRPRRHGRDRSSVGPVRTTGYCAAQRSQHACACTVACVQMQMCVRARTDVCVCVCVHMRVRARVCADVRGELHLCTCQRGRRWYTSRPARGSGRTRHRSGRAPASVHSWPAARWRGARLVSERLLSTRLCVVARTLMTRAADPRR